MGTNSSLLHPTQGSSCLSPGQVLCDSPQCFLLLGPVFGSCFIGHLQTQTLPAAWFQDLQGSGHVSDL